MFHGQRMNLASPMTGAVAVALLALVIPMATLHGGAGRPSEELTAPPFGWPRLLVAHFLSMVPLTWLIATRVARFAEAPAGLWLFLAAIVALVMPGVVSLVSELLSGLEANLLLRAVVRSFIASFCMLPGLAAATVIGRYPTPPSRPLHWAASLIIGFVPPWVYADRLIDVRVSQLQTALASGRFVKAQRLLRGLEEVGADPSAMTGGRLADVEHSIQRLMERVKYPLPADASVSRQIDRAFHLIQLDRLDEAAELLSPLSEQEPATAGLLLAAVRRDQKRWDEAIAAYRVVVDHLPLNAVEGRQTAFQGLTEALIAGGRPHEAEAILEQALREMPQLAAFWHWQLGQYYFRGGRPFLALEHLHRANELAPHTMGPRVAPLLESIRRATPGCLLR
jgi:hypothetical protein